MITSEIRTNCYNYPPVGRLRRAEAQATTELSYVTVATWSDWVVGAEGST